MSTGPQKTREIQNHHFDSTKWNDLKFRDDDIIISTAMKSGTTWTQNIITRLLKKADDGNMFHWVDLRVPPKEVLHPLLEGIEGRRVMKTHLPLDALRFNPKAKYIYIGRDGRDCFMSLFNHWKSGNDLWYQIINDSPGLRGAKLPVFAETGYTEATWFDDWISKSQGEIPGETDGYPFWSLFDNVASWWAHRHCPNILFMHYNDMLADLDGSIRRMARFLEIPIDEATFPALVEACTFKAMKKDVETGASDGDSSAAGSGGLFPKVNVPLDGAVFAGGKGDFINKGTNGRWRGVLSEEQLAKYDQVAAAKLPAECRDWLANGNGNRDLA